MVKEWTIGIGELGKPGDPDVLLKSTTSAHKRKEIERQEELDEVTHKAKIAEQEKKAKTAEADSEKAERKAETSESPFKVTGGVNIGTIDLQQQQKEATEKLEKLRVEAENAAGRTAMENQLLREKIHEANIEALKSTFQMQMDQLTKMIEANSSRKNFIEEYTEALNTAKALGLAQPSPETSNLESQIAIKKLDFDQSIALRQFSRDEKRADREFQRQLQKDSDERKVEDKKLELERTKRSELADSLKNAAAIFGQNMMRVKGEGGGTVSSRSPRGQKMPEIIAGVGETAVFECVNPECKQPVTIPPTTNTAICAGCDARYPIKREEEGEE